MKIPKEVTTQSLSTYLQHLLKLYGILGWRHHNGAVRHRGPGGRAKNPLAGFPDFCGVTRSGQFWAAEIKGPGDKLSEKQIFWLAQLSANGAITATITDFPQIVDLVQKLLQN